MTATQGDSEDTPHRTLKEKQQSPAPDVFHSRNVRGGFLRMTEQGEMRMLSVRWTLWNLFLAVLPVIAAYATAAFAKMGRRRGRRMGWLLAIPAAIIWFAFLPNTCYLLTEWRHFLFDPQFAALRRSVETDRTMLLTVAQWSVFYLLYTGFGCVCFTLSIRSIERLFHGRRTLLIALTVPFFFLISVGVYMGLIVRLNSWDIVRRPWIVWEVMLRVLTTPLLLNTVIVFAVLLWIIYQMIGIWIEGAQSRFGKYRHLFSAKH